MTSVEDPAPRSWPVKSSDVLLRNWLLTVRTDSVRMSDEHYASRTVVTHPGAVVILALDDDNRVLMIKQYRHPIGRELWELPAGLRDVDGESPLQAAQRELLEETQYRAAQWHTLADYFTSPGFSDERIRVFLARGLARCLEPDAGQGSPGGGKAPDEETYIVTDWVPLAETVRLALAGKLHSGPAITGVMAGYAAWSDGFAGLRPGDAPDV